MLQTDHLCVSRGSRSIIEDLNLIIPNNHFLVIAGANGVGKTTLLRALSGEIAPCSGSILLDRKPLSSYSQQVLAQRRTFLAQQTECRLPFRAIEVVRLGAEAAGLRGRLAQGAAKDSLERAGITHLADRVISQLSGGEQQRIHWARVLAQTGNQPKGHYFFLDEPVSSLDLAHQHELLALARSLSRSNASVVAVLHDLNLAAHYADSILLLHAGRAFKHGPPRDVFTRDIITMVFGVHVTIATNPLDGSPWVLVERK